MAQEFSGIGKKIPWLGAVLVIVVLGIGMQWWRELPRQTASRFVAGLYRGKFDVAATLLSDSTAIVPHADGSLTVNAADGSSVTFHRDDLPLMSYQDRSRKSRPDSADYIRGRYCFQVGAFQNRNREDRRMVVIDCVADGWQVSVETVRQH